MTRRTILSLVWAVLLVVMTPLPPTLVPHAFATFPGRNGPIVFEVQSDPYRRADPIGRGIVEWDLFVTAPGGVTERLTQGPDNDWYPAWSPDGTKIAFMRGPAESLASDIYVMDADGSDVVNVTNSPGTQDLSPTWSPDGRRIGFVSGAAVVGTGADTRYLDLWTMNADGSDATRLTDGASALQPDWSPNGRWIAYTSGNNIRLVTPDGSRDIPLPGVTAFADAPSWSPDGRVIAFAAGHDIWVVGVDGSGLKNLTQTPAEITGRGEEYNPSWSPDGKKIVFGSNQTEPTEVGYGSIALLSMNADGTGITEVVDIDLGGYSAPDWGPRP